MRTLPAFSLLQLSFPSLPNIISSHFICHPPPIRPIYHFSETGCLAVLVVDNVLIMSR